MLPGFSSSLYGPNAGRAVFRGLDGERVPILQKGMGLIDTSETSVDQAVWLETLTPLRIEVVHRLATLLNGPSGMGGAVVGMRGEF
jgi:iron complex outermembrane receptor protein